MGDLNFLLRWKCFTLAHLKVLLSDLRKTLRGGYYFSCCLGGLNFPSWEVGAQQQGRKFLPSSHPPFPT